MSRNGRTHCCAEALAQAAIPKLVVTTVVTTIRRHLPPAVVCCALAFGPAQALFAGAPDSSTTGADVAVLTLSEALELAMRRNFALRQARLDQQEARQQVRSARSDLYPQVDGTARYTRTFLAPDPFAGTQAGAAFGGQDLGPWLEFNELARSDGDPETNPITLEEFQRRSDAALANIGVRINPDANPFLVENQFVFGLAVTQALYDPAVFAGLEVSKVVEEAAKAGINIETLAVVRNVSTTFYDALLSARQVQVLVDSVARARSNVADTRVRVDEGVLPELQLLTAEVELANLETSLLRAENDASKALDAVRLQVGLPENQRIAVRGDLDLAEADLTEPSKEEAVRSALQRRPDLQRARLVIELNEAQRRATRANFFPRVSLIANASANGAVPDDRTFVVNANNPNDPFALRTTDSGFFADEFWFPVFTAGLQLTWNLFDGLGTSAEIRRNEIAAEKARVDLELARLRVRIEVEQSLRELATTRRQIDTQTRVRRLAERTYEQVQTQVREGVSAQFDLRQASEQLDESRFNYLQAVRDYLVARVGYLVAVGAPPVL